MSFATQYFNITDFSTTEHKVKCPFKHKLDGVEYTEGHASGYYNHEKHVFHCKACGRSASEISLIEEITGAGKEHAIKIYNAFNENDFSSEIANAIEANPLKEFGVSKELLESVGAFSNGSDISYPINYLNQTLDIRNYRKGGKPKVVSRKGATTGWIFPYDVWKVTPNTRWTILCAGEKDMMVARSQGFNAITLTCGEGGLPLTPKEFKDRFVAIVYDNDFAGKSGMERVAESIAPFAAKIKLIDISPICKNKGEDITDYFCKYGGTKESFIKLLSSSPVWAKHKEAAKAEGLPEMSLRSTLEVENLSKSCLSNVQVVGVSETSYIVPFEVKFENKPFKLKDERDMLRFIETGDAAIQKYFGAMIKNETGVADPVYTVTERHTIFKSSVMELDPEGQPVELPCYSIDFKLESGNKYRITHKIVTNPRTSAQVSIATAAEAANDSVQSFTLSPETISSLEKVASIEGNCKEKIHTLMDMLRAYLHYDGNESILLTEDLTFNTMIEFNFGRFKNIRGYLDSIIVSESRVGKSSIAKCLLELYQLGTVTSLAGSAATIPGLIGGSNKVAGGGMQTRAGSIPRNHKGLMIFEELAKASNDILAQMTDLRSSDEVRITRVSGELTLPARVRKLWLSNPKAIGTHIRSIESYPNGFAVITDLVGHAEDIARFDIINLVADRGKSNDLSWSPVEYYFDEKIFRDRIRWIWSRAPHQVKFEDEEYIHQTAKELNDNYATHIKLFGTEAWQKIARISIAVAGMLCSSDNTWENIVVKNEHIDFAKEYMTALYDNDTFRIKQIKAEEEADEIYDEHDLDILRELKCRFPEVYNELERNGNTQVNTLKTLGGIDFEINGLQLLSKHRFVKVNNGYANITVKFKRAATAMKEKKEQNNEATSV